MSDSKLAYVRRDGAEPTGGAGLIGRLALAGVILGGMVGYFAAHNFPFFGGNLMLGETGSPARAILVPWHMLLCSVLLGLAGLGLGLAMSRR